MKCNAELECWVSHNLTATVFRFSNTKFRQKGTNHFLHFAWHSELTCTLLCYIKTKEIAFYDPHLTYLTKGSLVKTKILSFSPFTLLYICHLVNSKQKSILAQISFIEMWIKGNKWNTFHLLILCWFCWFCCIELQDVKNSITTLCALAAQKETALQCMDTTVSCLITSKWFKQKLCLHC